MNNKMYELFGKFYLESNNFDYEKTAQEIRAIRITQFYPLGDILVIVCRCPGKLIGKKGENVEKLETYLKTKLKIVEDMSPDINDKLIPNDEEQYMTDYDPYNDDIF